MQLSMEQEIMVIRMHLSSTDGPPADFLGAGGVAGGYRSDIDRHGCEDDRNRTGHILMPTCAEASAPPLVASSPSPHRVLHEEKNEREVRRHVPMESAGCVEGMSEHHIHIHLDRKTGRSNALIGPAYGRYASVKSRPCAYLRRVARNGCLVTIDGLHMQEETW